MWRGLLSDGKKIILFEIKQGSMRYDIIDDLQMQFSTNNIPYEIKFRDGSRLPITNANEMIYVLENREGGPHKVLFRNNTCPIC